MMKRKSAFGALTLLILLVSFTSPEKKMPCDLTFYGYKGQVKSIHGESTYILKHQDSQDTFVSYQVIFYNRDGNMDSVIYWMKGQEQNKAKQIFQYNEEGYTIRATAAGKSFSAGYRIWISDTVFVEKYILSDSMYFVDSNYLFSNFRINYSAGQHFQNDSLVEYTHTFYGREKEGETEKVYSHDMLTGKTDTSIIQVQERDFYGNPLRTRQKSRDGNLFIRIRVFTYYP